MKRKEKKLNSKNISEEELENVSGGTTIRQFGALYYAVVTSGNRCPIENKFVYKTYKEARKDGHGAWWFFSRNKCCGRCQNLRIQDGIGFCNARYFEPTEHKEHKPGWVD